MMGDIFTNFWKLTKVDVHNAIIYYMKLLNDLFSFIKHRIINKLKIKTSTSFGVNVLSPQLC